MIRASRTILALLTAAVAGGCASGPDVAETDPPERILEKADSSLRRSMFNQAVERYQRLESLHPYSRHALQAQIMTAYAYYLQGEALAAEKAAERFIRLHPGNPHVDYMLYLQGLAHYKQIGEPDRDPEPAREAIEAFAKLLRKHPDSVFAPDAAKRLQRADRVLARHNLHIARYYFDREAYIAAANRCRTVLTEHPDSGQRAQALGLMARSYDRLRLDDLARDTLAVLKHNFPDSAAYSEARAALGEG
jgi:outer membrane protein assembly factor BamD